MILDVQNLTHHFENVKALNDVSFKIENNSIISILGPSGCGKTTLIRLISGLEESFKISLDTDDIVEFSSYKKGIEILKKYKIKF